MESRKRPAPDAKQVLQGSRTVTKREGTLAATAARRALADSKQQQQQSASANWHYRPVVTRRESLPRTHQPEKGCEDVAYWTVGQWGQMGGLPSSAASPKKLRASGGGKTGEHASKAPFPNPGGAVFAQLNGEGRVACPEDASRHQCNHTGKESAVKAAYAHPGGTLAQLEDLETQMRATLAALASFNGDERAVLLRRLREVTDEARRGGEVVPEEMCTLRHFRQAWKRVGVKVSSEPAQALFIKYGCDTHGMLPYQVFAAQLLAPATRLLGLAPSRKGAFKPGEDASFRGKISYRYCKKAVFPPSDWDGSLAARSAALPKAGLELEFVYGYDGKENTAPNVFYNAEGRIVYYLAALGVVYNPMSHTQRFFQGHDDDIRCLAMHPARRLVATGQMTGPGDCPFVCIWDSFGTPTQIQRLNFPSEGTPPVSSRFIVALAFSACGKRLVVVTGDNRHTTYVFDWAAGKIVSQDVGHNGQPPQVYGVVWNPYTFEKDAAGGLLPAPRMFVSYGVKHLKIWQLTKLEGREVYTSVCGKFGHAQVGDVMSACFLPSGWLVTGGQNGEILVWDVAPEGHKGSPAAFGCCVKVEAGHAPGALAPSIHDGQQVVQGVRAMCLRAAETELLTAGGDGQVLVWDTSGGKLGRIMKTIQVKELGERIPSLRAIDARPGHDAEVVIGTSACAIWALNRDAPEPLLFGHTGDLCHLAFHPTKPYRFATACGSSRVSLWNARRRQLIARCNVGAKARSVAFSPTGVHLAIGTAVGSIRVLMAEALKTVVADACHAAEAIDELQYSPDGTKLAAGSHDNSIDIFDVARGYQRIARCNGHSSYVTHLDWSADSKVIQSNCGAYELLYFDASSGKQVKANQRDTPWATWTCILGFPVMGIWHNTSDGTDINAACRSQACPQHNETDVLKGEGQCVVTSSDDGRVRLFNYPCVVDGAACREYGGHSSHVLCVRFSPDNRYVASAGGHDRAVIQWRVVADVDAAQAAIPAGLPAEIEVYEPPRRRLVDRAPDQSAAAKTDKARDADSGESKRFAPDPKECEYEVTVATSDIRGAGTDANVMLVVFGAAGHTPELRLDSHKNNFERGRSDVFTLRAPDVGPIDHIKIGQDQTGPAPGWHLDRVEIVNKTRNTPRLVFPCQQWLAADEGDRQCWRVLVPGGAKVKPRKYTVIVRTSDIRGAQTSAKVFITLFGSEANSGEVQLENSSHNFERGRSDEFEVAALIGDLQYIRIGHDNSGLGAAWHLQEVVVQSVGLPDVQFVADRWLADNEGDRQTYCTLQPSSGGGAAIPVHRYKVQTFTSDVKGSGTDASVYIIVFGEKGRDTGVRKLETSRNNFERGQEDIFYLDSPDLGQINEIEIGHDNRGLAAGWRLDQVLVTDENTGKLTRFPCDRWLADNEEDRLTRRRLPASDAASTTTSYQVVVTTSEERGAGTDANVHIVLIGTVGGKEVQTAKLPLNSSRNDFERGSVDHFLLQKQPRFDTLTGCRIGHDNAGAAPGWHLSHVEVINDATGEPTYFPCNQWFDKKEGDGLIERLLAPAVRDPKAVQCTYKVTVTTSDVKFGGTDANVSVEIFGKRDGVAVSSGKQKLANRKNNFERGQVDVFDLTCPNLGTVERLVIGHDNSSFGSDWHLAQVEVFSINTGQHVVFPADRWLSKSEAPYQITAELFPATANGETAPLCHYKIAVYTSDVRGAGTDANVTCVLHGAAGISPAFKLENGKDNFEKGHKDEFLVQSADVGKFTKLQIGHDNKGVSAAWHLQHVEVLNQSSGERATFVADRWLDAANGTVVTLEPSAGPQPKQRYKVMVQTADTRGAGTDADVSVILVGDKASSKELVLESSADNFEKGKMDEFLIDLGQQDLGTLAKVNIGFAGHQSTRGVLGGLLALCWRLKHVEVVHLASGTHYFFDYDDWLNGGKKRVDLAAGGGSSKGRYRINVTTSNIKGAGTDANVSIILFGQQDGKTTDSGAHKLENAANNFEKGATDVFEISCPDLGDQVSRVQISSDGSGGLGSAWHLQQVEVEDLIRGQSWVFPCERWLDKKDPASLQQVLLREGADPAAAKAKLLMYNVAVFTSDVRGAGTSASVSLQIWGDKDHTGPMALEAAHDDFDRGAKNEFLIKAPDVGNIQHIIIQHDNAGFSADWHLEQVQIFHPCLSKTFFFPCHDWLRKTREAGLTGCSRKLLPGAHDAATGLCDYQLVVHTSNLKGAGTDADISAVLYGASGDSGERKLDNSANNFERGQVDTFFIQCADLGPLQGLRLSAKGGGLTAAWHLAKVDVTNTTTGAKSVFAYNNWLDSKSGPSILLKPSSADGSADRTAKDAAVVSYEVTVHTSDVKAAGTDADVYIELHGPKGSVGEQRLENHPDNFHRNRKDVFTIMGTDLGRLEAISLRLDTASATAAWHPALVEVRCIRNGSSDPPSDSGSQTAGASPELFSFPCAAWLRKGPDNLLAKVRIPEASTEAGKAAQQTVTYQVQTLTSSRFGAGTDSAVSISLYGPAGMLGGKAWPLDNSANNFESGTEDTFFLSVPKLQDIGDTLTRVILEKAANSLPGSDWHLERLLVTDVQRKRSYTFSCGAWFSSKDGLVKSWAADKAGQKQDLTLVKTEGPTPPPAAADPPAAKSTTGADPQAGAGLHPSAAASMDPDPKAPLEIAKISSWGSHPAEAGAIAATARGADYTLRFVTSNKLGAGTDGKVFVQLTGSTGATWQPDFEQKPEAFEKGCTDVFTLHCAQDLGDIVAAHVWHNGIGMMSDWHLDKLEIVHAPTGRSWECGCRDWVGSAKSAQEAKKLPAKLTQAGASGASPSHPPASTAATPGPGAPPAAGAAKDASSSKPAASSAAPHAGAPTMSPNKPADKAPATHTPPSSTTPPPTAALLDPEPACAWTYRVDPVDRTTDPVTILPPGTPSKWKLRYWYNPNAQPHMVFEAPAEFTRWQAEHAAWQQRQQAKP
ncbi:hypothetical protein WJX72_009517 [[Myrmecia] bisecta]|uniref:PLAT domain-containing protein n=1 Tax=[Myrmecia] bisecta TaxID=41462 RepID=A0AAW1QSA2_9CHLO